MMHKSQFKKIDPYDWFCGPRSHMYIAATHLFAALKIVYVIFELLSICLFYKNCTKG